MPSIFAPLRPSSIQSRALLCLVGLLSLGTPPAWAEKADRDKPMHVESDALRYDDVRQVSVFTGKVVVTKGTILIRGARVEVVQSPEGFQFGTVTAEPGARAFYRQKREGLDEFIEGEGETIYYDGRADTVRFTRRAEMRRYKGSQLSDETSGDVIVYDNVAEVFTVNSGAAQGPGGRVRAMLTPTPRDPAAAAARPAAGAASAPVLRPSATLGGKK